MAPSEHGSRSTPPPPVPTLLVEDLDLLGVVLSWATGEVPPAGEVEDVMSASAAILVGKSLIKAFQSTTKEGLNRDADGRVSHVFMFTFVFFWSNLLVSCLAVLAPQWNGNKRTRVRAMFTLLQAWC